MNKTEFIKNIEREILSKVFNYLDEIQEIAAIRIYELPIKESYGDACIELMDKKLYETVKEFVEDIKIEEGFSLECVLLYNGKNKKKFSNNPKKSKKKIKKQAEKKFIYCFGEDC